MMLAIRTFILFFLLVILTVWTPVLGTLIGPTVVTTAATKSVTKVIAATTKEIAREPAVVKSVTKAIIVTTKKITRKPTVDTTTKAITATTKKITRKPTVDTTTKAITATTKKIIRKLTVVTTTGATKTKSATTTTATTTINPTVRTATTITTSAPTTTTTATTSTATTTTTSTTTTPTRVFAPQSTEELENAINVCIQTLPDCSMGPHGPIGTWDVSRVTDTYHLFTNKRSFNGDISNWDVSRVTKMDGMFAYALVFNSDISNWNVSSVVKMPCTFMHAKAFNKDISKWDVSHVTDMTQTFCGATAFNKDISKWDVSRVTSMSEMFRDAVFFNRDLSKWDVSRVTTMDRMFDGAISFTGAISKWGDISKWDVSRVTNMKYMFSVASHFNTDISKWNVSRVTNMNKMFFGADAFMRVLCGVSWVKSTASHEDRFRGSSGQISPHCAVPEATTIANAATPRWVFPVVYVVLAVVIIAVVAVLLVVLKNRSSKASLPGLPTQEFRVEASMPLVSPSNRNLRQAMMKDVCSASTRNLTSARTLATSNYKRFYAEAKAPMFQHELLHAVHNMLKLFATRINPTLTEDAVENGVQEFMEKIQKDAFKHNKALKNDVGAVSEYLWTSAKEHGVVRGMELCSVLNAVIREDVPEEIEAAAMIFRSINSRRVRRSVDLSKIKNLFDKQSYPSTGETWRGGGFRLQHREFFERIIDQKYRVPGFLATTIKRTVAKNFAFKADKDHPCALWRILFDPRGKTEHEYRVQHMTFVAKTLIKGEYEYLFAPYSVFKLVSIKWSDKLEKPHEFVIEPSLNNKEEDENLPLTPWY